MSRQHELLYQEVQHEIGTDDHDPAGRSRRALEADPLAYGGYWVVTCEECDKDYRIWPDRGGDPVCGECGTPLVAFVGYSELRN